jgi:predicted nucleic acid-binding protein
MRRHPAAVPRTTYVDSSALYALADRSEADYALARAVQRRLQAERWRLFTTNFILAETRALVLARRNRYDALRVLREIDDSPTTIVRAEADDERRAREILERYADKDFSLTDAISFAVMERLRIGHAFTFDRHFAQYGFAVLGPDDKT